MEQSRDSPPSTIVIAWFATKLTHDVHKAIGREKQMKGWTRAKKIALIEARNPRWEGLAEKWGAEMLFAGESMKDKR